MNSAIAGSVTPSNESDAAGLIAKAFASKTQLRIVGSNTRAGLGRPQPDGMILSTSGLKGITLYEPAELVIAARSGTPVRDIEAALAENQQALPFEPMDHRRLYGTDGEPTIGGVAAANISGPRRIKAGAARDSLLGVRFVNGRGEIIKAGGRVMKNVTGLDLAKVQCGAHGTLGLLTEVTFKVLPIADQTVTLSIEGLTDTEAVGLLAAALASPYEPTGAAHLPAMVNEGTARTLIRIEGFAEAIAHRSKALRDLLGHARLDVIKGEASRQVWNDIRDVSVLATPTDRVIWRVSTLPSQAAAMAGAVGAALPEAKWFYDWGGGLVWLSTKADGSAGADVIRKAVGVSGHATLVRAPDAVREAVSVFQPLAQPLMKLTAGIKQSFDPEGILNSGRMYEGL